MSTSLGKKIRKIRDSEGLSREEFAALTGIPAGTQKHYEMGRIESIGSEVFMKITTHPRFQKYALWLMTDTTSEAAGQISPALSPDGQEVTSSHPKVQKVG